MSYTDTHPPAFARVRWMGAAGWRAVWVWPEKVILGRHSPTANCPHAHRSESAAIKCAKTKVEEVES